MSLDAQALFNLLPAIQRIRDAELAEAQGLARGPLEELVALLAEQLGVAEEGLEQLYDDLFIETCADWVVPYIGDLIGYQGLHQVVPRVASPRAEVAHTIALRRRKGTASVLEQLARDVTGWDARAVEYFQRLCATQYMNHPRPQAIQAVDLRQSQALEWLGTAFETANRSVDVRRIESGRGRHNIANVGLHLWRIQAYARSQAPCLRAGVRRYRASPLGHDLALYNKPRVEDDIGHLAEPDNVPWPLSRRRLEAHLARHYGARANAAAPLDNPAPSLQLWVAGTLIEREQICICNLADEGAGWAHTPPADGCYSIDPLLGRIALPADTPDPTEVQLTWHEGFSADIGGGEYERGAELPTPPADRLLVRVPDEQPNIAAALAAIAGDGVVEITDNGCYEEALDIQVVADGAVEIRASNGRRPVLVLSQLDIRGAVDSACLLNGLLIAGAPLRVAAGAGNALAHLELRHCTLVPGIELDAAGQPQQPGVASLQLDIAGLQTLIASCLVGAIRAHEHGQVTASDSLIDACARDAVAFAASDGESPGAALTLQACTLVGKLHTSEVGLISNSILFAALAPADSWAAPVRALRKQVGCVRFSWLPFESIVPRRHRCQPASASSARHIAPRFTSLRYGTPAYGQLASATPPEVLQGADDESEMGVFHQLYGAQRLGNLRIRLAEYLRVGLHAGIFHES
ncbi:hypothetical protein [Pseudomonas sp. BMS12]|uniref:hypothetical protein n=1 Tax=Pseudomonas sp. BMS12 TaxID=1796033 RepID=UPI00083AA356|nr:hypothetical protein [Pseudomonas sp. BMS12]